MKSIFNKANAPYLVSGALATIALLASGVFAVAPYIGFLAPVAALSLGLPLIVVAAVFSVATIAFSCAAISKNNTIAEKNEVINQKKREILDKNKTIAEKEDQLNQQKTKILSLKDQLSNKEDEVKVHKQKISEKNDQITQTEEEMGIQAALGKALTSTKEAFTSGRATRIIKDGLKDAYSAMPSANSIKEIFGSVYDKSVEYTKGAPNSVKNGLKSIMPSVDSIEDTQAALGKAFISTKEAFISGRVNRIVKDGLKDVHDAIP